MVKYKLVNSNNNTSNQINQTGKGLEFVYPMVHTMTGLNVPNPNIISSGLVTNPFGFNNNSYIKTSIDGSIKVGIPLINSDTKGVNVLIPPKVDPKDPSVFLAVDSASSKKTKTLTKDSDVRLTFKEPEPKQSVVMFQPNLPAFPSRVSDLGLPVGLHAASAIVLNPNESKARLEISSPDSDDIITLSGEQDKIKPIYDGIVLNNKVRKAQERVILAGKEFESNKKKSDGSDINFDDYYVKSEAEIKADTTLSEVNKKVIIELKTAKEELKKAKKSAGLDDDDKDINISTDLIPLTDLFDEKKVVDEIKKLKISTFDEKDLAISKKKKDNISMMFGMPMSMPLNMNMSTGYGPVISLIK